MLTLFLLTLLLTLLSGYPVAFVLSGISILFAFLGHTTGTFDLSYLNAMPDRIYGIMQNDLLIAVPLFIFMGVTLERAKIAEALLEEMSRLFGRLHSGLGISVMLVGVLLAASTGIVGATVVTMGLISLPSMLKRGYCPGLSSGSICAAGTLGQIIPPSIVLILLADQIASAHQTTQLKLGNLSPNPVSIADIFLGAIMPGLLLVAAYMVWLLVKAKSTLPKKQEAFCIKRLLSVLIPPLALIILVLGSILGGLATATEASALGASGALLLAWYKKQLTFEQLRDIARQTTLTTTMIFTILIGATIFSLVFRGYGGDEVIHELLTTLPGGFITVMLLTMALIFVLGFILDFIEITFVVIPIIAPILLALGADPIWLAIMIAINLQTSFLTPPFGFALFYLRGVAPKSIATTTIYKGVIPFVVIQLLILGLLGFFPGLATELPKRWYGSEHSKAEAPAMEVEYDAYGVDF